MNSYTTNTTGNPSPTDQVTGWDIFNSLYTNNNGGGGGRTTDTATANNNSNAYEPNYYNMQQHPQPSQPQQGGQQSDYANQYYAAAHAAMNFGRPGYSLGMPVGGYYDPPPQPLQGYEHNLGGSSSSERYDNPNNGSHHQEYGMNGHIDESNAGMAQHHFHPVGTNGGNNEQDAASHAPQMGMLGAEQGFGNNNNNNNPYDYSGYTDYMQAAHQQRAAAAATTNNYGGAYQGNGVSLQESDYCDLLLRGLDNSTTAAAQQPNPNIHNMDANQMLHNQLMWNTMGGNPSMWPAAVSASNHAPTKSSRNTGVSNSKSNMGHLDYFMNSMKQQPYSSASTADNAASKSNPTSSTSHYNLKPSHNVKSLPHQVTTSTLSSAYLPHSNSSQPEKQIDPLLETLSLSVPSVSLQKLTGNEVIMHIRSKTDDVITRFLPCVDFLVNCQQELRQGLAIANQRKYVTTNNGRSRSSTANMTPSQFFKRFVAPLPKKFEGKNDYLMAREHLVPAKLQLDILVNDARNSIPQGCEHVKNTFLGGMRENESWGLRKWLSKHGGAGTICNDLEEVLRTVKALKKDDKTTIKLAEQLRPIASQAHERLKKDVPQAYQMQSSAHPYLPFFHRLEACLKQMANYDPEDDDVICLDSDEDDDVVEVVKPMDEHDKKTTDVPKSSAVKKRILHKREREEDDCNGEASTALSPRKRSKDLENIGILPARIEKTDCNGKQQEVICLDDSSEEEDDDDEQFKAQLLTLEGGIESPSQTPIPETDQTTNNSEMDRVKDGGWRCQHCTYPNAPNALKCTMCNDDDSAAGNETDELATFLGGGIMDDSNHNSDG